MITFETVVQRARIREKDGIPYPSNTSILQLAPLPPKYANLEALIGKEKMLETFDKASKRGNMAHDYAEDYIKGTFRSYNPELYCEPNETIAEKIKSIKKIQGFFNAMNVFINHYGGTIKAQPENAEKTLFFNVESNGRSYPVSTRVDLIADSFLSYGYTIFDYKTKTSFSGMHQFEKDKWGMQLAIGGLNSGYPIEHGIIVGLAENGRIQLFEYTLEELKRYYERAKLYVEQFYQIAAELGIKLIPNY